MDQLTSRQISEWEAYDRLDPIGTWTENFRLAYLSSLITNLALSIHGDKKKGYKFTSPLDFMINWDIEGNKVEPKKQSVEEMKQMLMSFAETQNRNVERTKLQSDKTRPPTNRRMTK